MYSISDLKRHWLIRAVAAPTYTYSIISFHCHKTLPYFYLNGTTSLFHDPGSEIVEKIILGNPALISFPTISEHGTGYGTTKGTTEDVLTLNTLRSVVPKPHFQLLKVTTSTSVTFIWEYPPWGEGHPVLESTFTMFTNCIISRFRISTPYIIQHLNFSYPASRFNFEPHLGSPRLLAPVPLFPKNCSLQLPVWYFIR